MKRKALIVSIVFALLAFACGFGGATLGLTLTQPAVPGSHAVVGFAVLQGDSANAVGDRLQQKGLVRNATFFKLLARARSLDRGLKQGTYTLSPNMSMDSIIATLLKGAPDPGIQITVGPGLRVTQYPALFKQLPNFSADRFMQMAKTGKEPDGTDLSKKFWFVAPPQKDAIYALEGYLYPDTFSFNATDDEVAVTEKLLTQFGYQLCPGPDSDPYKYVLDKAQCVLHDRVVNTDTKLTYFDSITKLYATKDETLALYQALTVASLTIREIDDHADAPGVAGVYYNRYLVASSKLASPPNDFVGYMGSDPSAEYARDTDSPPADGVSWWKPLNDAGKNVHPDNLYNTENPLHHGLPPGPIAAPTAPELVAAANPLTKPVYFYFISDGCEKAKIHYARTFPEFNAIVAKWLDKCPAA